VSVLQDGAYVVLLFAASWLAFRARGRWWFHVGGLAFACMAIAIADTTAERRWPLVPFLLNLGLLMLHLAIPPLVSQFRRRTSS
jgi:hypothetical protein